MISTVLFDLDGTLLPMDNDEFTKQYFKLLTAKLLPHGYEPDTLVEGIWAGTAAMVKNDGRVSNEEAFWQTFETQFSRRRATEEPLFLDFYSHEFNETRAFCGYTPAARETVALSKARGLRTALATNPLFPAVATESRIRWAGLEPADFAWYTTYENSRFCKPNPAYYQALLDQLGCRAEECLMVGNDADEDMAAQELGIRCFLLTDCLINRTGRDLSRYRRGGFPALQAWIREQGTPAER